MLFHTFMKEDGNSSKKVKKQPDNLPDGERNWTLIVIGIIVYFFAWTVWIWFR